MAKKYFKQTSYIRVYKKKFFDLRSCLNFWDQPCGILHYVYSYWASNPSSVLFGHFWRIAVRLLPMNFQHAILQCPTFVKPDRNVNNDVRFPWISEIKGREKKWERQLESSPAMYLPDFAISRSNSYTDAYFYPQIIRGHVKTRILIKDIATIIQNIKLWKFFHWLKFFWVFWACADL